MQGSDACLAPSVCSVKETDWRAELEAFRQGVAEDAERVHHQTERAVQEGRARLEGLHAAQQAQGARRLPQMTPAQLQQLNQVGVQSHHRVVAQATAVLRCTAVYL